MKKARARRQRHHARERAKERYGIELGKHKQHEIVDMIQRRQTTPRPDLRRSNRFGIHDVTYNGQELRVVFDRNLKTLTTVLPKET
jgi:hypothetical protein